MRRIAVFLVLGVLSANQSLGGGYAHISCPEFVRMEASQQVLFTKGFLGGLGAVMGVLNSAVKAVEKTATDPNQVKGAQLAAAGVQQALSGEASESDEAFAKAIATRCSQPEFAERSAASAAINLLMKAKP